MSEPQSVVVYFDFDKTIISKDCTAEYLRYLLGRSRWRKAMGMGLWTINRFVFRRIALTERAMAFRNSVFLWVATVGLTGHRHLSVRREFVRRLLARSDMQVFSEARDRLEAHRQAGHKIVIVSGALRWLVRDLCKNLDIQADNIIASTDQHFALGRVSRRFCFANNKITMLEEHGLNPANVHKVGYSDSATDIPMLSLCNEIYLINPRKACQLAFQEAFGNEVTTLTWELDKTSKY